MENKEERENTAGTAHEDLCHGILYLQGKNHNTRRQDEYLTGSIFYIINVIAMER